MPPTMIPEGPLRVINIGLELFAEQLAADGVAVIHVDWRPPAGGAEMARLLMALDDDEDPPAA